MKKGILIVILVLLIVASVGIYLTDVFWNGTDPIRHLFKMLAVSISCLGGLVRICFLQRRRSLAFYEAQYTNELSDAFSESFWDRKMLIGAARFYNEEKHAMAIKYLTTLWPKCRKRSDFEAVGIFLGSVFTDMKCHEQAIKVYRQLIDMDIYSTKIYSNLGFAYSASGHYDDAIASMHLALQNDAKNAYTYNNLAKLYFDTYDFENAIKYAKEALKINHKLHQAASLLAIIYAIQEDGEQAQKYMHIALSCGETPERMKLAIAHYRAAIMEKNDGDEEDENA